MTRLTRNDETDLNSPNEMTRVSATLKGAETSSFGVPGSKPGAFAIAAGSEVPPAKPRKLMSHALRNRTAVFVKCERFLSVGRVVIVRGSDLEPTNMGFRIRHYRLAMKCEDCELPFQQVATRAAIRRDQLRRRCERCKSPGKPTRAGAFLARERRRQKAAEAEKLRLDALFLRRIQKLSVAMGRPVPLNISFGDLLQAEQRQIRKTRRALQRTAWLLGVPMSEVLAMEVERRAKQRALVAVPESAT